LHQVVLPFSALLLLFVNNDLCIYRIFEKSRPFHFVLGIM